MKSTIRLFFISLISLTLIIICNCNGDKSNQDKESNEASKLVKFSVRGMICQSCSNSLTTVLMGKDGVRETDVGWQQKEENVSVSYDPTKTSVEKLKLAIEETGYQVTAIKEE